MGDHEQAKAYEGWTILELMGHRRLGGYVTEVELASAKFLRIDVPGKAEGEWLATQYYGAAAIYCLTPTTEAMARAVALRDQPEPVHRWELPAPDPEPERVAGRRRDYDDDPSDPFREPDDDDDEPGF